MKCTKTLKTIRNNTEPTFPSCDTIRDLDFSVDRYPVQFIDRAVDIAKCVHHNFRIHMLAEEFEKKEDHSKLRNLIKNKARGNPIEAAVRDALDGCSDQQLRQLLISFTEEEESLASGSEATVRSF